MKIFPLVLITLVLNAGCSQKIEECEPVPCVNVYPKLPTYKLPQSKKFKTSSYSDHARIIKTDILLELVRNNIKLRGICTKYAVINKRVNKEYQ